METLKNKFDSITQVDREIKIRQELKKSLCKPDVKDISFIPVLYELIEEISYEDETVDTFTYDPKHYFLLCVIFMYCPQVLIKKNMRVGIRKVVASVLGISESHTSNSCKQVRDWFEVYTDFQIKTNYLHNKILDKIEANGMK